MSSVTWQVRRSWVPGRPEAVGAAVAFALWILLVLVRVPVVSQVAAFAWPYALMLSLLRWFPEFSLQSWLASVALTVLCAVGLVSVASRFWGRHSAILGIGSAILAMVLATVVMQGAFPGAE